MELNQYIDLTIDKQLIVQALINDPEFLQLLANALSRHIGAKQTLTTATTPNPRSKIQQPIVQQSQTSQTPLAQ
jgi:hypothetical protein